MKNLTTVPYVIGDCTYLSPLGIVFLEKYSKELERHSAEMYELSKLVFEAAKRQLMQPINYQTKPKSKALEIAISQIEQEPLHYKRLDQLGIKLDSHFANLNPIPSNEVKELVKLERLLKPSIEFSNSILTYLNCSSLGKTDIEPFFVSAKKAGKILSVHANTIRNWDKDGLLKRYVTPNTRPVRYLYQDVVALLQPS